MMSPLHLVLDTNIWLDWLVFCDADITPIKAAIESGTAQVFIDAACERELVRVLAYPRKKFTLTSAAQAACVAHCHSVVQTGSRLLESARTTPVVASTVLPRCRDRDDQKFLELARDCQADFLITKDKALLELVRRKVRAPPFRIVTPQQFATVCGNSERGPELGRP